MFLGSSTRLMSKKRRVCPYANLLFALQAGKLRECPRRRIVLAGNPAGKCHLGGCKLLGVAMKVGYINLDAISFPESETVGCDGYHTGVTWQLRELGRVCLLCRGPCSCHLGAGNNGRATLSPGCC